MAKKSYRKAKKYFSVGFNRFKRNLPNVGEGVKQDFDFVKKKGKVALSAAELALLKGL